MEVSILRQLRNNKCLHEALDDLVLDQIDECITDMYREEHKKLNYSLNYIKHDIIKYKPNLLYKIGDCAVVQYTMNFEYCFQNECKFQLVCYKLIYNYKLHCLNNTKLLANDDYNIIKIQIIM